MESHKANVLFVDDEQAFLKQITQSIARRSSTFDCQVAVSENEALHIAQQVQPEVIILDLGLHPNGGPEVGLGLISTLLQIADAARILVLTGQSEIDWGIRCINAGAASFLSKPVGADHLLALIEDGIKVAQLMRASKANGDAKSAIATLGFTTRSDSMKQILDDIAFAAATPQPVLLCGETGVGKGFIAHLIHRASRRADGPFMRMQPSFGSHDLVNSELFGHVRGSFTGANENRVGLIEEANRGTLFLDEIDSLPQQTQIALLNVLQEKEFQRIGSNKKYQSDFRLISATNTRFDLLVDQSKLRLDFYHRIAHTVIHIPPLRERRPDIPQMAHDLVATLASQDEESTVSGLTSDTCNWLAAQPWPGNVRELHAAIERGYSHAKFYGRRLIRLSDIQRPLEPLESSSDAPLSEQLKVYELTIVSSVFAKNRQNYSATARSLGIDRKRLKRILSRAECRL